MMGEWVAKALQHGDMKQAELARLLTERLGRAIDRAAVNKMTLRDEKARKVTADEMLAISEITGYALPGRDDHLAAMAKVPLISWVSAGRLIEANVVAIRDAKILTFSGLGGGEFFALGVQGDSMDRVSPEGSIIVVNRRDRDLVDGKPYIFILQGDTTYKIWRSKPVKRLEPYSTNPSNEPHYVQRQRDFEVVGRVKRTVLDL